MTFKEQLQKADLPLLIPQATVLWCLLNVTDKGVEYMPLKLAGFIFLIMPKLLSEFKYWLFFVLTYLIYFLPNIFTADNHRWLFLYFLIGISIAKWQEAPKQSSFANSLKASTVPLLIVSFSLAFLWKVLSPQYMNGSFFEFMLSGGDNRFQDLAVLVLGYAPQEIKMNTYLIENYVPGSTISGYGSPLLITSSMRAAAWFFTYYALLIELLIPVLYGLSLKKPEFRRFATYALLLFIGSVYFITPVYGFGQLLALMGLASTDENKHQQYFIFAFLILIVLNAPWSYLMTY